MTPDALAQLHAEVFFLPPAWSAQDFVGFLSDPACFLCAAFHKEQLAAFALFRVAADEAELLTLATRSDARRRGLARALVQAGLARARRRGAHRCFLEVAADNQAACGLYHALGFVERGLRRGYYRHPPNPPKDALILCAALDHSHHVAADTAPYTIILY